MTASPSPPPVAQASASHRLALPGRGWELWRIAAVRGAGFAVDGLLELANPAAAVADRLLEAEAAKDSGARERLRAEYRREFDAGALRVSEAIDRIAAQDRFLEAVLLQNRDAVHTGIGLTPGERRVSATRNHDRRRREELVAKYWQRYCSKNDSIGFFGPVGWARISGPVDFTEVEPGPGLVASRSVLYEAWCIHELADAVARDPRYRPWLAPLLTPHLHVEGRTLYQPRRPPARLTPGEAAVLARCDGATPAREIAAAVIAEPETGLRQEADVYLLLENLRSRELVRWDFGLAAEVHTERRFRERLEAIADAELREPALARLEELEAARERVAEAADPRELDAALGELDDTFVRLTGVQPTRSHGSAYAGRTLTYLECTRDIRVEVGRDLLEAMEAPLSLLLQSCRWLTWETARAYREEIMGVYRELAAEAGSATVEMPDLFFWIQGMLFGDGPKPFDRVVEEYHRRWNEILGIEPGAAGPLAPVQRSAEELKPLVERAFEAPRAGWPSARYHGPDLQFAARSLEDVHAGRCLVVVGELHVAWNPLDSSCFVYQEPEPGQLVGYVEGDLPRPRVMPLLPLDWVRYTTRTRPLLIRPGDLRLGFTSAPIDPDGNPLVALSELVLEEIDGELVARTRDGRLRLEMIHLLGDLLSQVVVDGFRSLSAVPRRPRVTIDRLVMLRESWGFPAAGMAFAQVQDEADRFLAARRWAREQGLPRFVFVRTPTELKPFYVDFECHVYVNMLAAALRSTVKRGRGEDLVTFTEMLPAPEDVWLPDAEGGRYCSELRFIALDTA